METNLSKVILPSKRKNILRRARLIDALHRNLHRKLNFISASAGYGKSSLLVDFASDIDSIVCWYHATAGDDDLATFAWYMLHSFRQRFPAFGKDLEDVLKSTQGRLQPDRLAVGFINEFNSCVDDYCVFLMDDFHVAGECPAIAEFIEVLFDHLPEHIRILIASRTIFGIPSTQLYIHGEIATINDEDLRFRAAEIQAFIRQNFHYKVSKEEAERLAERSDGWIVAILLAAQAQSRGRMPDLDAISKDRLYEFLAREVIERETPALREFMCSVSIFDEFDEAQCNYVLQIGSAGEFIAEMEARNLFVTQVETYAGIRYRFHQLFQEFLRKQLGDLPLEKRRSLNARAAQWYRNKRSWELAVHYKIIAGDAIEAAKWMEHAAKEMYVGGRLAVLHQWGDALADRSEAIHYAPQVLLNLAKAYIDRGQLDVGERYLNQVEPIFQKLDYTDQRINALLTRSTILWMRGQPEDALAISEQVQKRLDTKDNLQHFRWLQSERLKGLSLARLGRLEEALQNLGNAKDGFAALLQKEKSTTWRSQIQHDLVRSLFSFGYLSYENGDIQGAQNALSEALKIEKSTNESPERLAAAYNDYGYLNYELGRYKIAWESFQRALQIIQPLAANSSLIFTLNSLGELQTDLEEWQAAEKTLERARNTGTQDLGEAPLRGTYLALCKLHARCGRFDQALFCLREAARIGQLTQESADYLTHQGLIFNEMGQFELAQEAFGTALRNGEYQPRPTKLQTLAAFGQARALFHQEQPEAGLRGLYQSMRWAAELGYDQFLVVEGRRAEALLGYALEQDPGNPQLAHLVDRMRSFRTGEEQFRRSATARIEAPPTHFEVLALGEGQVRRNSELILSSEWRAGRARILFFYLVENGGKAAATDIKNEFWPEFDAGRQNSNFQSTLWRTRQAIGGKEMLINQGDQYQLAPNIQLWYDVAEFRRHLSQARADQISTYEQAEHWRRAVELYRSDFLANTDMEWAANIRRQLQEEYLATLSSLAGWEMARSRHRSAQEYLHKILEKDGFRDDIHLRMMQAFVHAGAPNAAAAHFHRYREYLESEGLAPSVELADYYREISAPN